MSEAAVALAERMHKDIQMRVERIPVYLRFTAASSRKAEIVFAIPELLENILQWLSPLSLLRAQMMSRAADASIRTSKTLYRLSLIHI